MTTLIRRHPRWWHLIPRIESSARDNFDGVVDSADLATFYEIWRKKMRIADMKKRLRAYRIRRIKRCIFFWTRRKEKSFEIEGQDEQMADKKILSKH